VSPRHLSHQASKYGDLSVCELLKQVYLLTPMDHATLLQVKYTILHGQPSMITRQWVSVDSKLLCRPRNVGYYHIFKR